MSVKKEMFLAYSTGWKLAKEIAAFIEKNSEYRAFPLIPNGRYRKGLGVGADTIMGKLKNRIAGVILRTSIGGNIVSKSIAKIFGTKMIFPDFSLRYGAVAAGLGHIGWSGNLVTKEYGAALHLGGVLTTAPLEPDPIATENNCSKCKLCVKVCNSGFFSLHEEEDPVVIGGQKEVYAKRNVWGRCGIGCSGLSGGSSDGEWSIWSPNHISLANVAEEKIKDPQYITQLMKDLLYSETTSDEIRKFNRALVAEFPKGGLFTNVGLRSFELTNPRCGFCAMICVADLKKRKELYEILKASGKIFVDAEGKEYVKKEIDEGEEITYYPSIDI
jgi:ferredoxin